MIDSHCHLADPAFADDLEVVVLRAREAGVSDALCVVALGSADESRQAALARSLWPALHFAVGLHPHEARAYAGRADALVFALDAAWRGADATKTGASDEKGGGDNEKLGGGNPCAVGEIGLDYHYDLSPRDVQRDVFRSQVRYARERRLPIVIHTREADEDTLAILVEEGRREVRGVFHCFSGSAALASAALDLGFHLSFSGILTFPKAGPLREIAATTPVDRLLVETDCPYLAPVPHRGKRNEPAWVIETAKTVAAARGVSLDELARDTTANFVRLFGTPSL